MPARADVQRMAAPTDHGIHGMEDICARFFSHGGFPFAVNPVLDPMFKPRSPMTLDRLAFTTLK